MDGFVKISRYAGMREDIVQAGGGNSSYKIDGKKMIIKSSGIQLADVSATEGWSMVNYNIIKGCFSEVRKFSELQAHDSERILQEALIEGGRPSIETFLHAISGKYTLHTHPIVVNALTCRKNAKDILLKLFPDAMIVPYATPGIELAKTYFRSFFAHERKNNYQTKIVFLLNHGLLVSGETAEEVIQCTEKLLKIIEQYLAVDFDDYHEMTKLWGYFLDKIIWRVTDSHLINAAQKMNSQWNSSFCPDCVVFLGKKLLCLPKNFSQNDILEFMKTSGNPVMILWKGTYYILADNVKKALEIQSVMSFSAQVMLINSGIECNVLSDAEQNFLLGWDAEKYRRNLK